MGGITDFLPPQANGNFFASSTADPKFAANMGLFAGMVGGNLPAGLNAYAQEMGPDAQLKRADTAQQIWLRNLQAQQQQRMFDLQTPFLELAAARARAMAGGAPSSAAPATDGAASSPAVSSGMPAAPNGAPAGAAPSASAGQMPPQSAPVGQPAPVAAPASAGANQQLFPGVPDNIALGIIGTGGFGKLPETISKYNEPTDFGKILRDANIDPNSIIGQQLMRGQIAKLNNIPPTRLGEGAYNDPVRGVQGLPTTAPPGYINIRGEDGVWTTVPVRAGTQAVTASKKATALGTQLGTLGTGVDSNNNPVTYLGLPPGTIGAPTEDKPGAPSLPAPLRNNNPGALMPGGKLAQYPDLQTGLAALDQNLQHYGAQGVNTLAGVISKWAPPDGNDTQGYINSVSTRLGLAPNQPIDLSNAATRHALATGIMLQENGPKGVFAAPAASAQPSLPTDGVIRPALSQTAQDLTKIGGEYYNTATKDRQAVPMLRQALDEILNLATNPNNTFGPGTAEVARLKALANNAGIDMTQAQTAQDILGKLASNVVMTQLGQGGQTGTDAQMNQIIHATPGGQMTNEAIKQVIPLLQQQLDVRDARANVLENAMGQSKNLANLPTVANQFNRLASPPVVQLGMQLANASKQGALSKFMQGLTPQQKALLPTVRQLDQLGAF